MERRQRPQRAGVADQRVEPAPALVQGLAEPIDGGEVAQIAGDQCRRRFDVGAQGANFVVELLQRALGAGEGDDVATGGGEGEGDRATDAARSAGDQGDAGGGGFRREGHLGLASLDGIDRSGDGGESD